MNELVMDMCRYLRLIRFLYVSIIICTSVISFDEEPSSLIVLPGTEATFRCRHRVADIIGWLVNGTSVGQIVNSGITPGTIRYDGGILVHTLTIMASLEYDNLEVECVASFIHQQLPPTISPVVTLTVLEGLNETSYDGFIRVPSSFNVTEGREITFACQHARTNAIEWFINGTLRFDGDYPPNVTATIFSLPNRETVHSLQIRQSATNFNRAIIQCVAFIEIQPEKTLPALLLVQGPLQSVTSLSRNTTTLSWVPPSSLDVSDVDPDIVYCVEVYNITCGRRDLIISDCNVTEPSYTSDDIAPDGYIYEYTVTPRSNVEGVRNGSNTTMIEQFVCLNESARGWRVSVLNKSIRNVTVNVDVCQINQDVVKPMAFSVIFNSVDGIQDYDGHIVPVATTHSGNDSSVDIILEVPFRRVLDTTVLAYDCEEHPLTGAVELGTHDIYDISVSSPVPGVVVVTGDVIVESTSAGILAVVYSDFNISYYYVAHNSTQPGVYSVGVKLPDNQYHVSVFVVEENRQPFPRAAARPKPVIINGSSEVECEQSPIQYKLQLTLTGVCIICTFLDSSTTDCVAVVHQRISQLSSSGLMNIELNHKFNRSGDTAYGCIEGINLVLFQVGVIGADLAQGTPIVHSYSVGYAVGVSIGILLVAWLLSTMYVTIIVFCIKKRKQKKIDKSYESSIPMTAKTCEPECGEVTKCHSHATEVQETCLARSNDNMRDIECSSYARTIVTLKNQHDMPTVIMGSIQREPDCHSLIEEQQQPPAITQMFEDCQRSLSSVSSMERNGSISNIDIPATIYTENSDEAASQIDYPVDASESAFGSTSVLTLPYHESLIHTRAAYGVLNKKYSLERLKPLYFTSIMQVDNSAEESTVQSSKYEASQLETSQLVVGDREGFPVQVTDQNSPIDSHHIILPNVFFHPRPCSLSSNLSQEEFSVNSTSHTCTDVSETVIVKPENGPLLRSSRQLSVHRGHPETESDNKHSSVLLLPHF